MVALVDRTEFRAILKEAVKCVRNRLEAPGLSALTPEQIMSWFHQVTLEDLQVVMHEIEEDRGSSSR